jgi:LPS-assembly lipoprotein
MTVSDNASRVACDSGLSGGGRAARGWMRHLISLALLTAGLAGGCGFHIAGPSQLPFQSMYVSAPDYSSFGAEFKRYVASGGKTQLTTNPKEAQAVLEILSEARETQILSLNNAGQVAEYLLRYRVSFRLRGPNNSDLIAPSEITLQRDLTNNVNAVLAMENEQEFLFQDMKNDAMQQLLRRLVAVQVPS